MEAADVMLSPICRIEDLERRVKHLEHSLSLEQLQKQNHLLNEINERTKIMAMTEQELEAGVNKIKTTVGKVAAEQAKRFDDLSKEIADLKALIDAGGTISPAIEQAVVDTQAALDALDATIPDA